MDTGVVFLQVEELHEVQLVLRSVEELDGEGLIEGDVVPEVSLLGVVEEADGVGLFGGVEEALHDVLEVHEAQEEQADQQGYFL